MERVWKITEHTRELDVMEMMEVIRTWKKFGRPLSLVDRNMKKTGVNNTADSFDEGVRLLSRWLQQWQSQQLVIISIFTCSVLSYIGYIGDATTYVILEGSIFDMLNHMWFLFPMFLILITVVSPLWAIASLFPFKWELLKEEQNARVSNLLNLMIVLLVFSLIIIPFMIPVTIYSVVPFLILFLVNAYMMNVTENIRRVGRWRKRF